MIDIALIRPSRLGIWLCFGLYLSAFVLPAHVNGKYEPGVWLFLLGAVGLVLGVYGILYTLIEGLSWSNIHFVIATVPWLANTIFWFALALYAQGNGRASLRGGLAAVVLAAVVLITSGPLSGHEFFGPRAEHMLTQLSSPAYVAWSGSMALLVIFAAHLAWRQNRAAASWRPTAGWLAENEYASLQKLSRITPNTLVTSEAVAAEKPPDGEKRDSPS